MIDIKQCSNQLQLDLMKLIGANAFLKAFCMKCFYRYCKNISFVFVPNDFSKTVELISAKLGWLFFPIFGGPKGAK